MRFCVVPVIDIRSLRLDKGLSVQQAAAEIGVSRETLDRAEQGVLVPRPRNAFKIAGFYGFRVTEIWPVPEDIVA